MSVQTPPASQDIAPDRWPQLSVPWLLICLWSIYWTWHVVWWLVPPEVSSDDPDALFASIILSGPLLLLAVTGLEALRRRGSGGANAFRSIWVHCLGCLAIGALLFATGTIIGILGIGLLASAILDVPILLVLAWDRQQPDLGNESRRRFVGLLLAILGTVSVLLVWSWANAGLVAWRAREIAGANPYCLQVNDGARYQVVNGWSDLTGLRMTTPLRTSGITSGDTWHWAFHAVLVVDEDGEYRAYNWSYRAQSFVPLPDGPLIIGGYRFPRDVVIFCTPVPEFIETMGQHIPATPPLRHFPRLESSAYGLPRESPASEPFNPPPVPEPLSPAASWQEAFWSRLLTRYLSMKALVEVCEIDVEPLALEAVGRSADEASRNLGMTDAQTLDFAARVAAFTRDNGADYCDPNNRYRRDLMAAFPSPPSVR